MASTIKLKPWPEMHEEVGDLVRLLDENGPRVAGRWPAMGESPMWDMVYAQLLLAVRMAQLARYVQALDELQRMQANRLAEMMKQQGETIAQVVLELFEKQGAAHLSITRTTTGMYFVDDLPKTKARRLSEALLARAKLKRVKG